MHNPCRGAHCASVIAAYAATLLILTNNSQKQLKSQAKNSDISIRKSYVRDFNCFFAAVFHSINSGKTIAAHG